MVVVVVVFEHQQQYHHFRHRGCSDFGTAKQRSFSETMMSTMHEGDGDDDDDDDDVDVDDADDDDVLGNDDINYA